jgi:hypothetical protein
VAREARPIGRSAVDRAREIEALVDADDLVAALENTVRRLEQEEDQTLAQLEILLRPVTEHQWYVRERMADSLSELATAIAGVDSSLFAHLTAPLVTAIMEDPAFRGASDYITERAPSV